MRQKILDSIFQLMEVNDRIFFLTADMGINLVEKFGEKYPKRFLNVGIAEQNLIGICAGLCNLGFLPFAYTISNFVIHRCFEQIRNDIILHSYPITLLGTSTGFDNPPLGPTHHVLDDWGILKAYSSMDVYCPNSDEYALNLVSKIIKKNRPAYIRIPKGGFSDIQTQEELFYKKGSYKNTILISYGAPAKECLKVCEILNTSLLLLNQLHPLDYKLLNNIIKNYENIVVVEDQLSGIGLYNSLCEKFINSSHGKLFYSLSPKSFNFKVGKNVNFFFKDHKICSNSICEFVKKI